MIKCTIDARDLRCPEPLLKARESLKGLEPGECLEVLANDAGSVRDFHKMVELTNHTMVLFEEKQQSYRYILKAGT